MHFVYVLYSASTDKYYIGCSSDPESRLKKHLAHHGGYTGRIKDWSICYQECFENKIAALAREKQLKGWKSKIRIRQLVEGPNGG
ncbi:MAG: GIY-YIG nuclease family protein [Chitinophagaceae bacterium]|nr:GIY-YIG nuclease family protein [Chitinophagaceae bacterium]